MKVNIVASGSSGNCSFIEDENTIIFIDIGISMRRLADKVNVEKFNKKELFLFITHEHSDHIIGLKSFLRKFKPVVFTSEGTASYLEQKGYDVNNFYILKRDRLYNLSKFKVAPFNIPHDSFEPLGYKFFFGEKKLTFATDFGATSNYLLDYLNDNNFLLLESNYEDTLLFGGKYHKSLKRRIASIKGHLSNKEVFNLIYKLNTSKIDKIYLGHISEDNNDYNIVKRYVNMCAKYFYLDIGYIKQKVSLFDINI
ncbi:MAG: MBL fold metallo-hydrolase [Deferribacterota bacterium]|nr:MBL fold metallo-hydrolase [Deferribacterota bacterium]